jgi:hypothetical protein
MILTMDGTYKLTASPMLLVEGEFKGHLEYVTFVAEVGGVIKKIFIQNRANLVDQFNKLVERREAEAIVATLRTGEEVPLPGSYTREQLMLIGFRDDAL